MNCIACIVSVTGPSDFRASEPITDRRACEAIASSLAAGYLAGARHREVLSAEPDLEVAEYEDIKIVTTIVVRIALDAAAVGRGGHRTQDVDHGAASGTS